MILHVLPLKRLPKSLGIFSYKVPTYMDKLKVGQVVEVDFRGSVINALVVELSGASKGKMKNISKVVCELPIITKQQVDLIFKISEHYCVSPATVAKSLVPINPKKKFEFKEKKKAKTGKGNKKLVWYSSIDEKVAELKKVVKDNVKKQLLILVPEIDDIDRVVDQLSLSKKKVVKIHSKIATGKYFEIWMDILSGKSLIVIGTKKSVLLPFVNLGAVIVDDESDWGHKQSDINPRYDARTVAGWVAEFAGANLCLSSPSPSMESLNSSKAVKSKTLKNIKVIDLKIEQDKGNYTFISDDLKFSIENALKNKKQVFLLHNRKGRSGYVHCSDCGYVFKCVDCDLSMVYYTETHRMHCHHCDSKQDVPPFCPSCSGVGIKYSSKGIEEIASMIKKKFKEAKVSTLFKGEKYSAASNIVIGTVYGLKKVDWSKVGLAGVINFDQFLAQPDFRTHEKARKVLCDLSVYCKKDVLIQTYSASDVVFKPSYYVKEIESRKSFNYPPFTHLVKIISQDKSKVRAFYLADNLYKKLRDKPKVDVVGPLAAIPRKIRGLYKYHVIVKVKKMEDLVELSKLIDDDFLIDVDAERVT